MRTRITVHHSGTSQPLVIEHEHKTEWAWTTEGVVIKLWSKGLTIQREIRIRSVSLLDVETIND